MIGEGYQRILIEGKLCMSRENKLYIGSTLVATDPKSFITCDVVEYDTVSNEVLNNTVSFILPDNVRNVEGIYDNILKPFSGSMIFHKFQKSFDWFCCINEFVSFEKLFMYVLKQKYDKDYSKFMELCKSNVDKINWNTQDNEGNTMLHYVTIMNKYPEIACDIIRHIKETCKNLLNKGNKKGIVPLASTLYDKFICEHTKEANTNIIRGLINAGANLLFKSKDTDNYVWKGRDDQIFCVSTQEPETLLVAPTVKTTTKHSTYKICCLLKEPPECQLYSTTNLCTNLPKNLLELVLKFPCIQIHKILLTNNHCKFTSKMPDGTPCMHYIVEYGNKELVEIMFDRGLESSSIFKTNINSDTDFSLLDKSRNSILHTVIRKRKTDNAVVIMKRCEKTKTLRDMLDTQNISKETPLDLAIKEQQFSLIAYFKFNRPEIFHTIDIAGNSWFHRAVKDKSEGLLRVLTEQDNLENFIDSEDANQYTPFMLSVREKFVNGFKILKNTQKCRIDVHDAEGYTLLHLAIIHYETEIFSELLQVIVSDNKLRQIIDRRVEILTIQSIPSSQYHGLTPLLLSLRYQQFVAARLLLENGANINTLDCEGRTFNSYLIETCRDENELDFFTKKVDCIHNDVSSLSLSVQYTNKAVFDFLISKCDLDMIAYQDDSQNTVLSLILSNVKYTRFLKPLLSRLDVFYQDETKRGKLSESINKKNKKGETPLDISIISKNSELVGKLLDLGCDVTKDILHLATKHCNLQMVTCILTRVTNVQSNEMLSTYIQDQTPLHIAISKKQLDILEKFLSMNIDFTKQVNEEAILLNLAIEYGERTFQTVFEHFRMKDSQFLKNCLEIGPPRIPHCIIHSINHTNLLALKTLIKYNESYKNIIYGNLPLLHYAMNEQFVEGVKYLISLGLPLATHNSEQILTLHSDTLKLRLVFTDSKVGYKLGSGYVLTDIPNFEITEYCSGIITVGNIYVLFQNLVQCKILEPLQQYLSIHKSLTPKSITQLSLTSSKYATYKTMEYLLNSKDGQKCILDVNSKDNDGSTVVHNGIYNPCIQSFSLLLDHLDTINTDGWIFAGTRHIDQLNKQKYSSLELSMKEDKKEAFLTLRQHEASYATKGSGQNILHRYITCNITDISYLELILEDLSQQKSEIINEYNSTGYTPLHTAVSAGNTPVYSKLMALPSCNYDIVSKSERNNIVHLVIQKGNPELLKLILEDLNKRENDKNDENKLINRENTKQLTPQFLAVEEGNIDLILNMPEFSGVSADGINLLHHAVKCSDKSSKHLEMIKAIITKKEGMVNAGDKSNETPLHYAVKLPRESALSKLLECPSIDFSCQNRDGKTALHLAIYSNTNILKLLLNAIDKLSISSKIINIQDKEGKTALHHCIESTKYDKERLSLILATNPDLTLVDHKSNNIIHYAANCKVEVLKALIAHIKDKSLGIIIYLLSQQNKENNTPLYCAIQMKNIPCVNEFLKINATLPVIQVDERVTLCNRQPFPHTKVPMCLYDVKLKDKPDLHICVGFKLSDKQWILSDLPKLSCTYLTPLIHNHSQYQHVSKIPNDSIDESLLKSNLLACHCYEPLELVIDIVKDRKFTNEARLMHLAASCGTIQIVEYLIELYRADIPFSDLDNEGYSIIHYSIENKETQILRILCERMKRDHPQDFFELSGKLLQFCITEDHFEAFKILLEEQYSANVAYINTHGETFLHLIVLHSRNVSYVTELLKCPQLAASEFCNNVNKSSNTALHLAINEKDRNIVKEILKYSPDISIHDSHDNTALHLAIQNSIIDIIRDIVGYITRLPNKLELINKANNTESKSRPIHLATQRDLWEIVELLLNNGAELYYLDVYNNTILHLTVKLIKKNCFTMTSKILDYENKPGKSKFIHFQDTKGRTPLHLTIEDGCVDCIKLLLKQPINLSLVDTSGETILHYAIRRCNDDIFSLIYDHILLHAEDRCDLTPEHSRIFCLRNNKGQTPLHLSIQLQYQYAVEKLISQSVCVDSRDKEGLTILHYAAKFQNFESGILGKIIEITKSKSIPSLRNVVETEEILNSVDDLGRTPLLIAIESTKMFVLEAVMNCNPNFLIKDKEGNGVLIYAAKNPSSLDILQSLITRLRMTTPDVDSFSSLINELNLSGLSALHVSIYSGNLEVARLLVEKGAKLVVMQINSKIQTVGRSGLYSKKIELKIGTLNVPSDTDTEKIVIGYEFSSYTDVIYSTLPELDDVEFADSKDLEYDIESFIEKVLQSNCTELIEHIHERNSEYVKGISFLHLAAEHATSSIMRYICGNACFTYEFEGKNKSGETAVHFSVLNPCTEAVDCLLDKIELYEKDRNMAMKIIDLTDDNDCSPLKKSTEENKWGSFISLLKHGADFSKKDKKGTTILHAMVSKNDKESYQSLDHLITAINQSKLDSSKKQAMFNTTHNGLTAVHNAVKISNVTAAKQLINAGVDLTNINRSNGFTVVHTCANNPENKANMDLLKVLCKAVAKHDSQLFKQSQIIHKKDSGANTAIHLAIKNKKSEKVLEIMLSNGGSSSTGDLQGNTCLHLAAKNNLLPHVKTIFFAIQNDARDRGVGPSGRRGCCITELMRKNNKKELPILLTKDKDILLCMLKYWDNDIMLELSLYRKGNLLHFAVYNQEIHLVEAILESQSANTNFDLLRSRDTDNNSPLHIAAEKDNSDIGKLLINNGVDLNIRSARGTPIEVAIKCAAAGVASMLINEGADIKRFVFLLANDLISEKSVTRILDSKQSSIHGRYSTCYCSVIHYAARQSSVQRIAFLLEKGADLLAKDRDGRGAIHHVIACRRDPMILQALLDEAYRRDINDLESPNLDSLLERDSAGMSPAMFAAKLDYLAFFQVICSEKYKFHVDTFHLTDPDYNNVLHHLIKCNAMQCIRFLLPYLANNPGEGFSIIVNGRNILGLSPMGLARRKEQYETVDLLLKHCDKEFFECCPDVVHKIADEQDNKTLSNILDKMVLYDSKNARISTKIMDSNDEGGYPDFAIFNYHLAPLWHKMYSSKTNRIKYHPLLKFTVDAKIKLYQWWYLLMLFLYLLFYIPMVTALLLASVHCDEMLFYYNSLTDGFRLILELYIILITILYMINEVIEVYSKRKYLQNLPITSRKLVYRPPDQIRYYGLENLEGMVFKSVHRTFIEIPNRIKFYLHVFDRQKADYLLRALYTHVSGSYSILEVISIHLLLLMFCFRLVLFFTTSPTVSAIHWTLSALTFVAFTFKFFKYSKIFPTLGIYIETIFQVLKKDVPRFMIIILLILVGYAGGAHLVARRFGGTSGSPSDECSPSSWLGGDFNSIYSIWTPLLSGILFLVGGGPADFELELYEIHGIFSVFYLIFALGIIVVLLNIFIAQLSQTYSDVHSEKHIIDYKAELALHYENQSNLAFLFEWFFSKALRRIMVETVTVPIEEWRAYLKFYSERIDGDDRITFQDLKQPPHVETDTTCGNAGTDTTCASDEFNQLKEANAQLKTRQGALDTQLATLQSLIAQIQTTQQPGEQNNQSTRDRNQSVNTRSKSTTISVSS